MVTSNIRKQSIGCACLISSFLLFTGCAQLQEVGTGALVALQDGAQQFNKAMTGTFASKSFPASDTGDSCNSRVQALKADYQYFQQPLITRKANQHFASALQMILQGGDASQVMSTTVQNFAQDLVHTSLRQATKEYLGSVATDNNGNYGLVSQRVSSDAFNDSDRLAGVQTKIASLESCRKQQIQTITRDYKRKRVTAKQARQQAEQVQSRVRRDNGIIENMVGQSGERVDVYVEADQYVAQKRTVKSKKRKKRSKPSRSVAKAQKNQKQAKKAQQKIAQLDQTIEQEKSGFV